MSDKDWKVGTMKMVITYEGSYGISGCDKEYAKNFLNEDKEIHEGVMQQLVLEGSLPSLRSIFENSTFHFEFEMLDEPEELEDDDEHI